MRVNVLLAKKSFKCSLRGSLKNFVFLTKSELYFEYNVCLKGFAYRRKTKFVKALLTRKYDVRNFDHMQHQSGTVLSHLPFGITKDVPEHVLYLLENILIFVYQGLKARSTCDLILAATVFYKLQSQCGNFPLNVDMFHRLKDYITQIFKEPEEEVVQKRITKPDQPLLQQQGFLEELTMDNLISQSKQALEIWPKLQKTSLWKKIHKTMMFMSASALYASRKDKNVDAKFVAKIEKELYTSETLFKMDMTHAMMETLLVLTEKGYQIYTTGEVGHIFHSGKTYELWLEESVDLIAKSDYLCNPGPHGIVPHAYQKKVDDLIEQGQDILKMSCDIPKMTVGAIRSTVSKLSSVKAYFINAMSANATRRAPLAIVIEGEPGGGKTHFSDLLHMHYAKVRDKDISFGNRYTHNARAKHWDGYKSYMWSLLMDDLASENPDKSSEIPQGINDLLGIMNNAPFMPPMAALEDKAKCPFTGELCVITTNSPYMHLHSYFATPAAAARRMKYHVRIKPKEEFMTSSLLDTSKLPPSVVGAYADWWDIEVLQVKLLPPTVSHESQPFNMRYVLQPIHNFTSIVDFMLWYNGVISDHHLVQDKIEESTANVINTTICEKCKLPKIQCVCMTEQGLVQVIAYNTLQSVFTLVFLFLIDFILANFISITAYIIATIYNTFVYFIAITAKRKYKEVCDAIWAKITIRNAFRGLIELYKDFDYKAAIRLAGDMIRDQIRCPKVLITLAAILVACIAAYAVYLGLQETYNQQTHIESGERPKGNELENVWYNSTYQVDSFDVGRLTSSWKGLKDNEIEEQILRNTVNCSFYFFDDGKRKRDVSSALCIGGQVYLTTSHSIPTESDVEVEVVSNHIGQLGHMTSMTLRQEDVMRVGRIAMFRIHKLPPKANITQLLMGDAVKSFVGDALLLGKNRDGSIKKKKIRAIRYGTARSEQDGLVQSMCGYATPETVAGDCGSAYVFKTGRGPVIGGLHELGNGPKCAAVPIDKDALSKYIDLDTLISNSKPDMKAQTAEKILSDLHVKSPVRFIDRGHASVYGSFVGFRAHMKTRVRDTMLRPIMEEEGFTTDLEPPILKGWKPVRANLIKLVSDTPSVNTTLLQNAVEGLFHDWIEITASELDLITVYDDLTITNGAPGVRFVDAINRKTSAGFPWNKSKKYFMDVIEVPGYDNCKKFTPEILERANNIIEKYLNHERACPVFSGSLKDKAVSKAKNLEFKVRMFMGAPVDFTYVMRKYLLSFVRVMQRNKFFFESAPGIEAQCAEWDSLYHYLTHFGKDNCVFGDFKSFDTSMPPEFLLAAFDLIISFHKMAGCSDEHVTIIEGIMYDIVYAYADVKGDLLQLIGKNPSGHALTVTINSIVNCLYMRYAYCMHNPLEPGECYDFKQHVHLITYGDDNGMNVSESIPWFNHNSIASALATINVTYTMADKVSESVPYIPICEASFLKRKFRYEDSLGKFVCPLDPESIIGSLMIGEASDFVSDKNQLGSVICSANDEWFWHGRETFDEWHTRLHGYIDTLDLFDYMPCKLATWSDLCKRYESNSLAYYGNDDVEKYERQSLTEVLEAPVSAVIVVVNIICAFISICFWLGFSFVVITIDEKTTRIAQEKGCETLVSQDRCFEPEVPFNILVTRANYCLYFAIHFTIGICIFFKGSADLKFLWLYLCPLLYMCVFTNGLTFMVLYTSYRLL